MNTAAEGVQLQRAIDNVRKSCEGDAIDPNELRESKLLLCKVAQRAIDTGLSTSLNTLLSYCCFTSPSPFLYLS